MKNLLFVMTGGAGGAALRYGISMLCKCWRLTALPVATFTVNILGCFLLGLLIGLGSRYAHFSGPAYLMLTVGFCGAFTTFSTFSADTFRLIGNGQCWMALLYLLASIIIGFGLFYLGIKCTGAQSFKI